MLNIIRRELKASTPLTVRGVMARERSEVIKCAICHHETAATRFIELPCSHKFHLLCIDHWCSVKKECPLCRRDLE
jgi:hypothetical protein